MPEAVTSVPTPPQLLSDQYLTEAQLAQILGRSRRQVYRYFEQRVGPPRITIGKLVLYRRAAVEAWLASHEIPPRPKSRRGRSVAK